MVSPTEFLGWFRFFFPTTQNGSRELGQVRGFYGYKYFDKMCEDDLIIFNHKEEPGLGIPSEYIEVGSVFSLPYTFNHNNRNLMYIVYVIHV